MTIHPTTWENRLLARAHEAFITPTIDNQIVSGKDVLAWAYDYCTRITKHNSRTFYLASLLLPREKRQAVQALYAFCRSTDDLVDETQDLASADEVFANWRVRLNNVHPAAHDPVPLAWADVQAQYRIPRGYADQLITGVARDRIQKRYQSFNDLTEYCYGVASTVGLMSMSIIGFKSRDALPYAVKLGIALQLTNILRDIGEDLHTGRLYLPLDELAMFGLTEQDVMARRNDERWQAFMRFQIERVNHLYDEASAGIALLNKDGRFAIGAATKLYRAILNDIEAHNYDVFNRRAYVGTVGKLRRLPRIWYSTRYND
jgi:phytoene synthase